MNVGDYVRIKTLSGQGKIAKLEKIDDICITDTGAIDKNNIIKSSPQIIDLIEHMDILYLKKPIKIYGMDKTVRLFNPVRCDGFTTYDDGTHCIILNLDYIVDVNDLEIEAIVTHEQMEAMQYRVEE